MWGSNESQGDTNTRTPILVYSTHSPFLGRDQQAQLTPLTVAPPPFLTVPPHLLPSTLHPILTDSVESPPSSLQADQSRERSAVLSETPKAVTVLQLKEK